MRGGRAEVNCERGGQSIPAIFGYLTEDEFHQVILAGLAENHPVNRQRLSQRIDTRRIARQGQDRRITLNAGIPFGKHPVRGSTPVGGRIVR